MGGQRLTLASRLQVTRPRVGVGHTLQAERPDGGLANVGARWSGHQGQIRLRIERGHPGRRGCRDRGGGGGAERDVRTPPPVPCGWGAAPLPLLTEGLAFFPSSSPLWSVTRHAILLPGGSLGRGRPCRRLGVRPALPGPPGCSAFQLAEGASRVQGGRGARSHVARGSRATSAREHVSSLGAWPSGVPRSRAQCAGHGRGALGTGIWGPGGAEQERAEAALELTWPADGHPAGRLCG